MKKYFFWHLVAKMKHRSTMSRMIAQIILVIADMIVHVLASSSKIDILINNN